MSAFVQSMQVTGGFQIGNLSDSFQPTCEAILQTDVPGFPNRLYTDTCSEITSHIASASVADLVTRSMFLGVGTYCMTKGVSTISKASSAHTWSKTLGQAARGSMTLACGVAMTAYAVLLPFDPVPYDTGAAHDDLLAALPH